MCVILSINYSMVKLNASLQSGLDEMGIQTRAPSSVCCKDIMSLLASNITPVNRAK